MEAATKLLGCHIFIDSIYSPSIDDGRNLLNAFESRGFSCIYGEVLRLVDEGLGKIPFRPLIEISGCDVFTNREGDFWIFCKIPDRHVEVPIEGNRRYIDFVVISPNGNSMALDSLRDICRQLFGAILMKKVVGELHSHHGINVQYPEPSMSGRLLANESVRGYFRETYGFQMSEVEKLGPERRYPRGLWLESMVADAFEDIGEQVQIGIQAGIDEIDVFVSPFGRELLVECKDSNLKLNDISIVRAKANRLGIRNVLMIVTDNYIHPNLYEVVDVWSDSNPPSVSTPIPPSSVSAYVAHSFLELRSFLERLTLWMKLDLLGEWIQGEDTRSIIPWFTSRNSWGETISRASDWYPVKADT